MLVGRLGCWGRGSWNVGGTCLLGRRHSMGEHGSGGGRAKDMSSSASSLLRPGLSARDMQIVADAS